MYSKEQVVRKAIMSYLDSLMGAELFKTIYSNMMSRSDIYPTCDIRTFKKYFQKLINQRAISPSKSVGFQFQEDAYYHQSERYKKHRGWIKDQMSFRNYYTDGELAHFTNVRALGVLNPETANNTNSVSNAVHRVLALDYGGMYYPATMSEELKIVKAARFAFHVMVENFGYDEYGQWQQAYTICLVTGWNTVSSEPGRGLADLLAKVVSPGKYLSFRANSHIIASKIFKDGKWTGEYKPKTVYVMCPGSVVFGNDGYKLLDMETLNYTGVASFDARPPKWDVVGHPDMIAWQAVKTWRISSNYEGGPTYGYAKVGEIKGGDDNGKTVSHW